MEWRLGTFSAQAWEATESIRRRIDQLPLLVELADGSLDPARFVEYIVQDDFYLRGYSRALSLLGARAPHSLATEFWATSAGGAVAAEQIMHRQVLGDPRLAAAVRPGVASPTTRAYVNFLQTAVAYESYPVGVAAVLPCYWVYADVGLSLAERAGELSGHPYSVWVAAYADQSFLQATQRAIELLDEAAEGADGATRHHMLTAFVDATHYEELFWKRSYEREVWAPV